MRDEADTIFIELNGAPRGKGRPRFRTITTKAGRTFSTAYTDSETRKFEGALSAAARDAMQGKAILDGPIEALIVAHMPIPESWPVKKREAAINGQLLPTVKPDADNIGKICDALNGIAFLDDKQIVDCHIRKRYSVQPRLTIELRPVLVAAPLLEAAQ